MNSVQTEAVLTKYLGRKKIKVSKRYVLTVLIKMYFQIPFKPETINWTHLQYIHRIHFFYILVHMYLKCTRHMKVHLHIIFPAAS